MPPVEAVQALPLFVDQKGALLEGSHTMIMLVPLVDETATVPPLAPLGREVNEVQVRPSLSE